MCEKNITDDKYTDEKYTDEKYTDEKYTDEKYTDEKYTDEKYTDEKYTDEKYTDEKYTDEKYTDEKSTDEKYTDEKYTSELLKTQYNLHKTYVIGRIHTTNKINVKIRLPFIPEDISENIIKNIINNKLCDTSSWDCKTGDLQSQKEGKQECKCFTSDGPISFTPTSNWDIIYFLDARNWLNDNFILYKVSLKKSDEIWKNIKVNKKQTFDEQCKQQRRPRIKWVSLLPQISSYCEKVYDGTFIDIFKS